MTVDQLLTAIGGVDDTLLAVCDNIPPVKHTAWKWASAAACLVVSAVAIIAALHGTRLPLSPDKETTQIAAAGNETVSAQPSERRETVAEDDTDIVFSSAQQQTQPNTTTPAQEGASQIHLPNQPVQEETSVQSGISSDGLYSGDRETAGGKNTEVQNSALWDKAPITTKYPSMQWNGGTYASRGRAELNGQVLKQVLGTATLQGFDGDPSHKTTVQVMPIRGIAPDAAVAVQFPGNAMYYAYVCQTYAPKTLGQMIADLRLKENCTFTGASGCGGSYAATVYSAPAESEVWKLLDGSAALDTQKKLRPAVVLVRYSLPLLGETSSSFEVTEDGYVTVHFCEKELCYFVGRERAAAFMEYVEKNGNPKRLAEGTTTGYTATYNTITTAKP